jgi:hypothetical protein
MLALVASLALIAPLDLTTTAEKTGFARTGRYEEAVRLCHALATAHPGRARCFELGQTPEGRPMVALAASADGALSAKAARARQRTVVVLQGANHAGECDGKDAGFILLRELLAARDGGPLARVTVIFIPVANVDGHERFGPGQRPNQRGPEEGGWRTTAQNYNLNRDYVKADAPETRALLRLLDEWDPIVYADLHVTDGAQFQHDLSVTMEPRLGYAEPLRSRGQALSRALMERLSASGHLPIDFYPMFRVDDDPASGFAAWPVPPRFVHGYWAARNRFGILLETHSWHTYGERVHGTVDFLRALLDIAARDGEGWRAAAQQADREAAALAGQEIPLAWGPGEVGGTIDFRGYAYVRELSPILGRTVVRYDETKPEIWRVPLILDPRTTATATLPKGGWIVPCAHAAWMEEKLGLHGIRFERIAGARRGLEVEVFRASEVRFRGDSFEGHQTVGLTGNWAPERRDLAAGALWVPAAQAAARIAAILLEPASPDSLVAWGFFNTAFERKEYIEDYVLEPFAQALIEKDASVRAEFERRLGDLSFAKDPAARADFFYRRHPAFDEAYCLYPILRAAERP